VGLIVGFIFSMPIAGPISILITSNALKGRLRYCNLATIGASFADFVFVFIAVFGLTKFYSLYKPFIPYILAGGSIFLLIVGYRIARTRVDIEHMHEGKMAEKIEEKHYGAFWTGFLISFLNPTLFLSWMTSSFFIISLVASLGFNTGGLDRNIGANFQSISSTAGDSTKVLHISHSRLDSLKIMHHQLTDEQLAKFPDYFPVLLSACYALFLALGSIIWFYYLANFLSKFRKRININHINRIIQALGIALCCFGIFLGYKAIGLFV